VRASVNYLMHFTVSKGLGVERRAAGLFCNEAKMTPQPPIRRGHTWQKIKATDCISNENGVEWQEVCIHCYSRRQMGMRANGRARVLGTDPANLPRQCVRRAREESGDGTKQPGRDRGRPSLG